MANFNAHPTAGHFSFSMNLLFPAASGYVYGSHSYTGTSPSTPSRFEFRWDGIPLIDPVTHETWYYGPLYVRFNGSGFTFDGAGNPTGGTCTSVLVYDFDHTTVWYTLSGISIPLAQVLTFDDSDIAALFTGNDSIVGGPSDEILPDAGGGIDHISGGGGYDAIGGIDRSGSTEDETVSIANPAVLQTMSDGTTIVGIEEIEITTGSGNDTLTGNNSSDWLIAGEGNNTLSGGDGSDYLVTGAGHDTIDGGGGDDEIHAGLGVNHIDGGADGEYGDAAWIDERDSTSDEVITFVDPLIVQTFADGGTVVNVERVVQWYSGSGNDTLTGGALANHIYAGAGNDTVNGHTGNDWIEGGDGDDMLVGGTLDDPNDLDVLIGGNGNDTMDGGYGYDVAFGQDGNDTVHSRDHQSQFYFDGGAGTDLAIIDRTSATANLTLSLPGQIFHDEAELPGDYALQDLLSVERLEFTGGSGNDTVTGGALADIILGGGGIDTIDGGAGGDAMTGGDGSDIYYVDNVGDVVTEATVNIAIGGTDRVIASITYTLPVNVESLTMVGTGPIVGNGNASNNFMSGNAQANTLRAWGGNDVFYGNLGNDWISGGLGQDYFVFNTAPGPNNRDGITDFSHVDDTIRLENAIFTGLGLTTGTLAAAQFHTGAAAHDADDRIIYNSANGQILYDADGLDGAAAVLFATLTNKPQDIDRTDFVII